MQSPTCLKSWSGGRNCAGWIFCGYLLAMLTSTILSADSWREWPPEAKVKLYRRLLETAQPSTSKLTRTTLTRLLSRQQRVTWNPHTPTPKQQGFLNCANREALYGGSAGGGKSDALLMAALQYVDTPGYAAILFRKTFQDLALPGALIDRAHEWLGARPAKWNGTEKTWTFPSGATLSFGYLDNENDKYRYQGAEFQFIGFDELTQFTESKYTYLFSRLRRKTGLDVPLRMRAASNPGGVGHEWVKRRFITDPETRAYIPAGLRDNPFVDQESYLQSLGELDHLTRRQLLDGDWNAVANGDIFKREWFRYYFESPNDPGVYDLDGRFVNLADCFTFGTVDLAISEKTTADYTVIAAWALTPDSQLILLDLRRDRFPGPRIVPEIFAVNDQWKLDYMGIEKVGFQEYLIREAMGKGLTVRPLRPRGSKSSRARAASVRFENGQVWFPRKARWLGELENEMLQFADDEDAYAHDDMVDAVTYACLEVGRHRGYKSELPATDADDTPIETAEPDPAYDPYMDADQWD